MRRVRRVAAVVGGVSWNHVIDLPMLPQGRTQTLFATDSREGIGGTGSGKALNLARLGFETRLHALIGRRRRALPSPPGASSRRTLPILS